MDPTPLGPRPNLPSLDTQQWKVPPFVALQGTPRLIQEKKGHSRIWEEQRREKKVNLATAIVFKALYHPAE